MRRHILIRDAIRALSDFIICLFSKCNNSQILVVTCCLKRGALFYQGVIMSDGERESTICESENNMAEVLRARDRAAIEIALSSLGEFVGFSDSSDCSSEDEVRHRTSNLMVFLLFFTRPLPALVPSINFWFIFYCPAGRRQRHGTCWVVRRQRRSRRHGGERRCSLHEPQPVIRAVRRAIVVLDRCWFFHGL